MNITYNIEFHTFWHCGSGLSAGADVDSLVIKENNLPYVPGKTIKGLVREAVEDLVTFGDALLTEQQIDRAFGHVGEQQGCMFFTNASLPAAEQQEIIAHELADYLYSDIANTAIDESGVAKKFSLRKTEVTIPCTLEGQIIDVPNDVVETLQKALKMIKRIGQSRNRGLGRCTITIK